MATTLAALGVTVVGVALVFFYCMHRSSGGTVVPVVDGQKKLAETGQQASHGKLSQKDELEKKNSLDGPGTTGEPFAKSIVPPLAH